MTVVDPGHPLYGLTLPLRGMVAHPRLGLLCTVALAPGVERLISIGATDRAGVVPPPSR